MALDIKRELGAVDSRNKDFYDSLDDKEKKEFSPYILMRYVSNVQGDQDVQESFALPAGLIEFVNDNVPRSIGNGVQIYEPLVVRIYTIMNQLDSGTGTQNQNLDMASQRTYIKPFYTTKEQLQLLYTI